jgi:glycogen(starch) synthase
MRILFWCDAFPPAMGGIPVIAADLVASLEERGHELHVIADESPADTPTSHPGGGFAIDRYPFIEVLRSGNTSRILSLARSIGELKHAVRPDVVLAFALTPSLFFHLQTRLAWPAPLMVTLHGGLPFQAQSSQSLVGRTLENADWVMTCSESCLREAGDLYPFIAGKSSVVRNALEHRTTPPSRLRLEPPRLLCVGRLSHEKGVDVAIAALPTVLERAPDARLRIVGEGPLSRVLRDLAEESGLAGRVEFLGFVSRDEVRRLLAESSIVVVPSRSEGFSLVALEAAQAGRPVVATRVGGIPEVVIDGETGLLVRAEAPAAMAAAILALLRDPGGAERMAAKARRWAEGSFRWSDYVDAYDDRIAALRGR